MRPAQCILCAQNTLNKKRQRSVGSFFRAYMHHTSLMLRIMISGARRATGFFILIDLLMDIELSTICRRLK